MTLTFGHDRFVGENFLDDDGNPAGGFARGTGIDINFQDGPLGRGAERKEPNGAFIEDLLRIVRYRLQFYQGSRFSCRENALALTKVEEAIHWLESRTMERESRNVEGTHSK